jgi:Ala-tRNA(Pro) deacylase
VATQDLTKVLDLEGVEYELLPHVHTESALAEAHALALDPTDVAKTVVVETPKGYARAVLPASERLDLGKLSEFLGFGKKEIHLASEGALARDYPEFDLGAVPPIGGSRSEPVVMDRARGGHARGVDPGRPRGARAAHRRQGRRHLAGLTAQSSRE